MSGKIKIPDCDVAVLVMDSLSGLGAYLDANARVLRRLIAAQILNNDNSEVYAETVADAVCIATALRDFSPVDEWSPGVREERFSLLFHIFENLESIHEHDRCLSRAIVELDNEQTEQ